MNVHKMARLTPLPQGERLRRCGGRGAFAVVARQFAMSRQTVDKWVWR